MKKKSSFFLGLRTSALLEILAFFLILIAIESIGGTTNRLLDLTPHPVWIIVIITAVLYGTGEALVAVLLSVLYLYAGNIPPLVFGETRFDYYIRLAWQPLGLLASAFVLGETRVRQRQEMERARHAEADANHRAEAITAAYEKLKIVKENLEIRLASQKQHAVDTYQAMNALSYVHPSEMLSTFLHVVTAAAEPEACSLYVVREDGAHCIESRGWHAPEEFTRHFPDHSPLFQSVVRQRELLLANNPEHETLLNRQGVAAIPIIHPYHHQTIGFLKLERLAFLEFSQPTIELLRVLCDWLAGLYALRHQTSSAEDLLSPPKATTPQA
jgi:polysaccharide biosynthesis protein PelD